MKYRHLFTFVTLWTITLFAAPTFAADEPKTPADLAAAAKEILRANCSECHSQEDARADVRVLDHAGLLEGEYIVPTKPDDSYLYQLITSTDDDSMPPKSRPALTAEQIAVIRKWIAGGAEKFPTDIKKASIEVQPSDSPIEKTETEKAPIEKPETEANAGDFATQAEVYDVILEHVRQTPKQDRPFLRYFSLRHLLDGGVTPQRIADHRLSLAKAINHFSREREMVVPTSIDVAETVFAVDLRKLGWHRKLLADKDDKTQTLDLFDLVLLEYPYTIIPADSDTFDQLEDELFHATKQVRPIAYVRVDWFCSVVLQPPLYHDMLQLPRKLDELEQQLGIDVKSNLDSGIAKRAGMAVSGVSRNNRAVERHPHSDGYYWKSHDFQSNIGSENILKDPIDFLPSGGEMIFRLPNGSQAYFVCDARGNRIDEAPTSIVVDKFASDRVVKNGLGCIRCHRAGIKDFSDSVRGVLEALPGNPGFDKRKALQLYPTSEEWDKLIEADQKMFAEAMAKIGDIDRRRSVLASVTSDYLEGSLTVAEVAAELGVDAEQLKAICRAPGFTRLGLAPLAAGGVIRRDAWEDNFDAAASLMGAGTPIVGIDGNLRREFVPSPQLDKIELRTNKENNFFEPGDGLRVTVANNSGKEVHFELFGTSIEGRKVRLTEGVQQLSAGASFSFPEDESQTIEIRGGLGKEAITLFASTAEFSNGRIFRGKNIADRVVHNFYNKDRSEDVRRDTVDVIKKTILIETR